MLNIFSQLRVNSKITIFTVLIIFLLLINNCKNQSKKEHNLNEEDLNENEKKFHLRNDKRYDDIITDNWSRDLAIAYRDWAGLGYMSKESANSQIAEIKKGDKKNIARIGFFLRKFIEEGDWEHITTYSGDEDIHHFSYSIFRNIRLGKLICTFSGTKGPTQLINEYLDSNMVNFSRVENDDDLKNMKIMEYFNFLYMKIYEQLYEDMKKALDLNDSQEIKQIIFTGHSLGGAMASIAALDLIQNKIIYTINSEDIKSPILITYGQPRTGNYVFANEAKRKIPIIFRHANNYDLIVNMPFCYKENDFCINEYKKKNFR